MPCQRTLTMGAEGLGAVAGGVEPAADDDGVCESSGDGVSWAGPGVGDVVGDGDGPPVPEGSDASAEALEAGPPAELVAPLPDPVPDRGCT